MRQSKLTRRDLLKRSTAGLLAAGLTASAGCTEALPPLGQRVQYGRVDVPDENSHSPKADSPTYRRWFPAASALPDDDLIPTTGEFRNGFVNYATPATLGHDVVGFDNKDVHFYQKPYLDYFGIDYESFEQVIGMFELSSTYVLVGDIDPSTVADALLDSGYSEASSYGEYSLFDRDDEPRTAAVTDGTIVWARHPKSTALVKAVIDAGNGDVQRHHEANEAFALATDAIGTRPWIHVGGLGVDPTGEALIRSLSYTFNETDIFYLHHTLYPDGQSITEQEVKDALNQNTRGRSAWAVDIQIEDRLLTVEMGLAPSQRPTDYSNVTVPQITWGIDHSDGEITIRHEAGDSTPAETISLYAKSGGDQSALDAQFSDRYDTIKPGDSITFAEPAADVTHIYGGFSPTDVPRGARFPLYTLP